MKENVLKKHIVLFGYTTTFYLSILWKKEKLKAPFKRIIIIFFLLVFCVFSKIKKKYCSDTLLYIAWIFHQQEAKILLSFFVWIIIWIPLNISTKAFLNNSQKIFFLFLEQLILTKIQSSMMIRVSDSVLFWPGSFEMY